MDGGHCGAGKWMQTMCLVKFEIDLGSSTTCSEMYIDVHFQICIFHFQMVSALTTQVSTTKTFGCQG